MARPHIRIVSRKSPLAMWQANHVRDRLTAAHPDVHIEIIGITTQGDRITDQSLASAGGKGLFIKELEQALLDGRADLAVHSMKDVTVDLPDGLAIPVILERGDPRDAWVSTRFAHIDDLPPGARVGTASLRRRCQLLARRPGAKVVEVRGNVGTRLAKLDAGEMDGMILAAAGLARLGETQRIRARLEPDIWLPAIGQGAIGIEVRADDRKTIDLITPLDHADTHCCVAGERAVNRRLSGDCHVPIAGFGTIEDGRLRLRALVGRIDGSETISASISGEADAAETLGDMLAGQLLEQGAGAMLEEFTGGGAS